MISLVVIVAVLLPIAYVALFRPIREYNYLKKWSEIDKERHKHFLLAVDALEEGRSASYIWHMQIAERLGVEAQKAWNERERLAG